MPRGRQHYDPIIQVPGRVEATEDLSRIELFPVTEDTRIETATPGKWMARHITAGGTVTSHTSGDFDHDRALAEAQAQWPNLPVYELRSEFEDSTWEGVGPSPRLWQAPSVETAAEGRIKNVVAEAFKNATPDEQKEMLGDVGRLVNALADQSGDENLTPAVQLHALPINEVGMYVLLSDICELLEVWAVQFEIDKNPSGALALREAVDALKDVG